MPVLSATVKLWVFAALVMTVFIVILSTKTAVNYHPAHRHLSPLLHQHLSHQHPSVTKSVTKNVTVIVDPRVVVKEERVVDITEDVIFSITQAVSELEPTRTTYSKVTEVTEEKVVVKEAKVAITKTLATLSAKLSVNNKFQQMYSLCVLCVFLYNIYF